MVYKLNKSSLLIWYCIVQIILVILIVVQFRNNAERICRNAWEGCEMDKWCNQDCYETYNGNGSCYKYKPPSSKTFIIECLCDYPC
ncbi:hypothetical protein MKW94_023711 [Papaver nudicaule]|uniref:Defensin-like protein n=1 Tax=Papaver nudicaule TaxID=74823 RepID=A0AA41UYL2_PAPNU|nr:hypothetical protein [Papaver nudicaule]